MAREVDPHLSRMRRDCAETIAAATRDASLMREKCAALGEQARELLEGAGSREAFAGRLEAASGLLAEARARLVAAMDAVHGIDVTVEVPDCPELRR